MDIHHNQVLTGSQMEPERNPTSSPLLSSLQLPPNLRVSCRVAGATVHLGVVRTRGVEIVLPIIDRLYSDGSIGFYGGLKRVLRLVLSAICEFFK